MNPAPRTSPLIFNKLPARDPGHSPGLLVQLQCPKMSPEFRPSVLKSMFRVALPTHFWRHLKFFFECALYRTSVCYLEIGVLYLEKIIAAWTEGLHSPNRIAEALQASTSNL